MSLIRHACFTSVLICLVGCDALEGQRFLLPRAETSIFVPSNWETIATPADKDTDAAALEAHPRDTKNPLLRGVQLRVFTKFNDVTGLEDMVKQTLIDVSRLEKQGTVSMVDATQIELKRRGFRAARVVHKLNLGAKGTTQLPVTQYTDLLYRPGMGLVLLVSGPTAGIDEVAPEIERILSSVRSLVPEPEVERVTPPAYVSMSFPRSLQRILLGR